MKDVGKEALEETKRHKVLAQNSAFPPEFSPRYELFLHSIFAVLSCLIPPRLIFVPASRIPVSMVQGDQGFFFQEVVTLGFRIDGNGRVREREENRDHNKADGR